VHHEIADLLQQVRRLQHLQIAHTVKVYRVPMAVASSLKLIGDKPRVHNRGAGFERDLESVADPRIVRVTLFNGQTGTVQVHDEGMNVNLLLNSAINNDLFESPAGQTISVNLSAPASLHPGDVLAATRSVTIPNGQTAWLHLPGHMSQAGPNGEQMVLLVAVTSEIVTPEEELLGTVEP
jgi:hypothetical protein